MSIQSIHHGLEIRILFVNIIKDIWSLTHYYQSATYIIISWHIMSCRLAKMYMLFKSTYTLHFQGTKILNQIFLLGQKWRQ